MTRQGGESKASNNNKIMYARWDMLFAPLNPPEY